MAQAQGLPGVDGPPPTFEFWDRGGSPGPGYEQNLLRLWRRAPRSRACFTRVRFDSEALAFRADDFWLDVPPKYDTTLLGAAAEALVGTDAEERDPRVGGGTKMTVTLHGAVTEQKTFHGALPARLRHLGELISDLTALCERDGAQKTRFEG